MRKVSSFLIEDLIKNWVIIGYFLMLAFTGWGFFIIETNPEKVLMGLMQVTILAVPLISMVFATIYYYNSFEFILVLLSQPVERKTIIASFFVSLGFIFTACYWLGIGAPLLILNFSVNSLMLLLSGSLLTLIFTSIALLICAFTKDKARGMGLTLLVWSFFAFIFDGILLFLMYQYGDYPIEKAVLGLSFLNPLDLGRILVIMRTDAAALLGYTGAIFRDFFSNFNGTVISVVVLLIWTVWPFLAARKKFIRKDL